MGDELEDWVRMPAHDLDLSARIHNLSLRAEHRPTASPELDDSGVLRVGHARVVLSPVEARVTRVLLARRLSLAPRDTLVTAAWPAGTRGSSSFDVLMFRLRSKLAGVGLRIRTLHGRGYLLE
jgi:DNA-binding response OmpR family regulator